MSTLYLIRHGKTQANLEHRYCGSTDLPLSQEGILELQGLRYAVPRVRFVTSGMKRTEETLRILFGPVPHTQDPAFREVDFGVFEMHTYEELKDRADYQAWLTGDNMANIPPEGESGQQMTQRILEALPGLLEEDTVLITHGGVIAAIMENLFPEEQKNRYQWQPAPGRGYAVTGKKYSPIPEKGLTNRAI